MKRARLLAGKVLMERKSHWETVYTTKPPTEVSWYQAHPQKSLELIKRTGVSEEAGIIDVGGGASNLVDHLLDSGFQNLTMLDIASAALELAKARLGARAESVEWIEADITQAVLPTARYDVWHDRAVFHFLTDAESRRRYIDAVERSLKPGGHLIVATFAAEGQLKCSGLNVVGYDPRKLHDEFGDGFELIEGVNEVHRTPSGTTQKFIYCRCRKC